MSRIAVRRAAACAALIALLAPGVAAAEYDADRKFARGLAGMTLFFLEPPGNMVQLTRERGPGWGLTLGFAQGVGKMIPRLMVGVYEFLTAPFAVPADFRPILAPEYTFQYFEQPVR